LEFQSTVRGMHKLIRRLRNFGHRLLHWEYWHYALIYYPLFPIWLFWSLRNRTLFFFNAVNPGFNYGGLTLASKMDMYKALPLGSYPQTILWNPEEEASPGHIELRLRQSQLKFPLILKPDMGYRGMGVKLIEDKQTLSRELSSHQWSYLLQEYIPYTNEVGVFYVRRPGDSQGTVTGVVEKHFLKVVGDGQRSLEDLIDDQPRSRMQYNRLLQEYGYEAFQEILRQGEEKVLVPFGSHSRGAEFRDVSARLSPAMLEAIQAICDRMPGFYYGRLDILFKNWDSLLRGQNFKVIEVNGVASEPTHIYDPEHSLFFAWKEIIRHCALMERIARANQARGCGFMSHREGRTMLRQHRDLANFLQNI